jgi:hypothetical protein
MIPKEEFPVELQPVYDMIKFDRNLLRTSFIEIKTKYIMMEDPSIEENVARETANSIANGYNRGNTGNMGHLGGQNGRRRL